MEWRSAFFSGLIITAIIMVVSAVIASKTDNDSGGHAAATGVAIGGAVGVIITGVGLWASW